MLAVLAYDTSEFVNIFFNYLTTARNHKLEFDYRALVVVFIVVVSSVEQLLALE